MIQAAKKRVSQLVSATPPLGGLNTLAPAANMPETFARRIMNFFPGEFSLRAREGYAEWNTGLPSKCETILPYLDPNGSQRHFSATDVGLYESSSKAPIGAVVHALTEARCSYVQFTTVADAYLVVCNGVDPSFLFDGTSFITMTNVVTPVAPGEISGVDPAKLIAVYSHNRRLWFVERNSMMLWYLPIDQVGGVMTQFPVGSIFRRGGKIKAIFAMSVDSGEGLDDVFLILTDQGEIAGYVGGNVDDFEEWHLSAVHYIGHPHTDRPFCALAGDVLILTTYGVVSLQSIISNPGKPISSSNTISKNIYPTLLAELRARGEATNWEIFTHPTKQSVSVIFPLTASRRGRQFVMNIETGAWGEYNLPMITAGTVGNELFFSTDSGTDPVDPANYRICRFGDVYLDNISLDGTTYKDIIASFAQAYNYFGRRGVNKHFNLLKLSWLTAYPPSYKMDLSCDYIENTNFELIPLPPDLSVAGLALWDVAIWDSDVWPPETIPVVLKWDGLGWLGYCASLLVEVRVNRSMELVVEEWAFEEGQSL